MRNLLLILFKLCVVLLLCGGTLLVMGQLAGVAFQKGALIRESWDLFADPTFVISAVAGVLAYLLSYLREPAADRPALNRKETAPAEDDKAQSFRDTP